MSYSESGFDDFASIDEDVARNLLTCDAQRLAFRDLTSTRPYPLPAWFPPDIQARVIAGESAYPEEFYCSLETELHDFYEFLQLTPAETAVRRWLVDRVQTVVRELFNRPHAEVHVYGSFGNGMAISTSDIDISVGGLTGWTAEELVMRLERELRVRHMVVMSQAITKTSVPIVKATCALTGLNYDISFTTSNGIEHRAIVDRLIQKYPLFQPLNQFFKYFLHTRGLDEPHNGGVGGYLLLNLVGSFLASREYAMPASSAVAAGLYEDQWPFARAVLEFFDWLSYMNFSAATLLPPDGFHMDMLSIIPRRANNRSEFACKSRRRGGNGPAPLTNAVSCADPQDPQYDVGGGAFAFRDVRRSLGLCLVALMAPPGGPAPSLLSRICANSPRGLFMRERAEQVAALLNLL